MNKQAVVVGFSLVPFGLSVSFAYIAWLAFPSVEAWHIIVTAIVWIISFAAGSQLFWKVVERLAPKQ